MKPSDRVRRALNKYQKKPVVQQGILGNELGVLAVPNRVDYVYVRVAGLGSIPVYNKRVPLILDLPVDVGYDPLEPKNFQVLNIHRYPQGGGRELVDVATVLHGKTHNWAGIDPVYIEKRQLMPLRPTPLGGMNVYITREVTYYDDQAVGVTGQQLNLAPYVPTTGSLMVLIYKDTDEIIKVQTGGALKDLFSLTLDDAPVAYPGTVPIALVRLYGGQSGIAEGHTDTDLIDVRQLFSPLQTTGTSSGSGGHVIQEEGSDLPARGHLNFVGAGVIASDDAGNDRTNILITGSSGGISTGTLLDLMDWYDAIVDGGCHADGLTDDTAHIQSLINTATANGTRSATIYFPPGVYLIGGALQDTGAFNGQILLPAVEEASPQITLRFIGANRPPFNCIGGGGMPNPGGYSILKSTLAGASGTAACISGGNSGTFNTFNNISVVVENMLCSAPDNPTFTFWNLAYTQGGGFKDVQVATPGGWAGTPVEPTNSNSYGVKLPGKYYSNYIITEALSIGEFYTCLLDGELAIHKGLILGNCIVCIEEPETSYQCVALNVQMTGFQYGIKGSGTHYLDVINYCAEHVTAAGWRHTLYDIEDPGNYIHGHVRWFNAATGGTADHSFTKNGGTNVLSEEMGSAPSPVAFPISPSNVYDPEISSSDTGVDDSYTKSLLHMDGADASTVFTDESGKNWTPGGLAQIDTAQSKFSGASAMFGTGSYIETPDNIDFYFDGDFTIDFWCRPHLLPGGTDYQFLYEHATDADNLMYILLYGDGRIYFRVNSGGSFIVDMNGVHGMANDTAWYHVALVRNGTAWNVYINGNSVVSATDADGPANYTGQPRAFEKFNGWIDEFRISKGIARWTTNFTPPTAHYGPVVAPQLDVVTVDLAESVENQVPQWAAVDGKLKAGFPVVTTIGNPGADTNIPTEKAVRDALTTGTGGGDVATDTIWNAKGDLVVGAGVDSATILPISTHGKYLRINTGTVIGIEWDTLTGGGDVLGPATSVDHSIARFNGTDNKTIQGSLATVADDGSINISTGTYNIGGTPHTHSSTAFTEYCSVYGDAVSQTNITEAAIACAHENYDPTGMHDNSTNNSRITIANAGYYHVTAQVLYAPHSTGNRAVEVRNKGAAMYSRFEGALGSPFQNAVGISFDVYLAANDYLEIYGYQSSGGALDATVTFFTVHRFA